MCDEALHTNYARIKSIGSNENCCDSDINHHVAPIRFVMVWKVQSHKYDFNTRIVLIRACASTSAGRSVIWERGRMLSQPKSSSLTTTPPICSTWLSHRQTLLSTFAFWTENDPPFNKVISRRRGTAQIYVIQQNALKLEKGELSLAGLSVTCTERKRLTLSKEQTLNHNDSLVFQNLAGCIGGNRKMCLIDD